MVRFHASQRVEVFDPKLQCPVAGTVTSATGGCVVVSLDDRMVPVAVDPADSHRIRPLEMTGPVITLTTQGLL